MQAQVVHLYSQVMHSLSAHRWNGALNGRLPFVSGNRLSNGNILKPLMRLHGGCGLIGC
jgi:hypothetical protein